MPPHSNYTRHIFLGYLVQHECSLCLFGLNESVMNRSGTSEKQWIISLHITFKFMMLALLPNDCLQFCLMWLPQNGSLSFALPAFDAQGLMGKIPALCLIGRELSCWWNGKWVMMKASFEVNLSWTMNTTGSQR